MNFQKIIKNITEIDKNVINIIKNGLKGSFIFCLIAIFILATYTSVGEPIAFYIGISLLKTGLFYVVGVIVCGMAFNKIIND